MLMLLVRIVVQPSAKGFLTTCQKNASIILPWVMSYSLGTLTHALVFLHMIRLKMETVAGSWSFFALPFQTALTVASNRCSIVQVPILESQFDLIMAMLH
jgi:hypothetical protein